MTNASTYATLYIDGRRAENAEEAVTIERINGAVEHEYQAWERLLTAEATLHEAQHRVHLDYAILYHAKTAYEVARDAYLAEYGEQSKYSAKREGTRAQARAVRLLRTPDRLLPRGPGDVETIV